MERIHERVGPQIERNLYCAVFSQLCVRGVASQLIWHQLLTLLKQQKGQPLDTTGWFSLGWAAWERMSDVETPEDYMFYHYVCKSKF